MGTLSVLPILVNVVFDRQAQTMYPFVYENSYNNLGRFQSPAFHASQPLRFNIKVYLRSNDFELSFALNFRKLTNRGVTFSNVLATDVNVVVVELKIIQLCRIHLTSVKNASVDQYL